MTACSVHCGHCGRCTAAWEIADELVCECCGEPADEGGVLCPACAHDADTRCLMCGVEIAASENYCSAHCAALAAGDSPEDDTYETGGSNE